MHDGDAIEVHDSFETVGNGDDGAVVEFGADEALHKGVGVVVDAVRKSVSARKWVLSDEVGEEE